MLFAVVTAFVEILIKVVFLLGVFTRRKLLHLSLDDSVHLFQEVFLLLDHLVLSHLWKQFQNLSLALFKELLLVLLDVLVA